MLPNRLVSAVAAALLFAAACGGEEPTAGGTGDGGAPELAGVRIEGDATTDGTLEAIVDPLGGELPEGASVSYVWYVNGKAASEQSPTLTGDSFERGDEVYVAATPQLGEVVGESVSSAVVVIQNSPPSITGAQLDASTYRTNDTIAASATGWADLDGDAPGYSYAWFINGAQAAGEAGATLAGTHFQKGDRVYATITPHDGAAAGEASSSDSVVIANTPPETGAAVLAAGPFGAGAEITLASTSGWSDIDGDAEQYRYQWYVDGSPLFAATAAALPGGSATKGQAVKLMLIPYDGDDEGTPVFTNEVVIQNSAPEVASVSLGAGPYYESSALTAAVNAVDLDAGDTVSVSLTWYVNGAAAGSGASLNGASFAKHQWVWVVATPFDGEAYGPAVSAAATKIQNSPPAVAAAPLSAGPFTTAATLTFDPGAVTGWSDADGDPAGYTYQWFVDGSAVAGQVGTSLSGAYFSKGQTVRLRVTPFDGEDAGTAVYSNTVTIANAAPVVTAASISSAGPRFSVSYALTLNRSATDADAGDAASLTYTYAWYKNGALIAGQTGQTLAPAYFAKTDAVWAHVRVFDGVAYSAPVSTAPVTIGNALPVVSNVQISSGYYLIGGPTPPLTVTYSISDPDAGDAPTVVIRWYRDGTEQPAYDDVSAVPFADLRNDELWAAGVTAHDGEEAAEPVVAGPSYIVLSLFDAFTTSGPALFDTAAIKDAATLNVTYVSDAPCPSDPAKYRCRDVHFSSPYPNGAAAPLTTAAWVVVPASITKPLAALIWLHGSGGARDREYAVTLQQLMAMYELLNPARQLAVIAISGPGSEGSNGPTIAEARSKMFPDPRDNWDYLYAYVAMRTITFAATVTGVNASYIGMSGVSAGGIATLLANGVDNRLAAGVPVSASGYYMEAARQGSWISIPEGAPAEVTNAIERWLDPRAFLPTQHAPIKLLNGSQDEFFPLSSTRLTYDALPVARNIFMQPNFDHYVYYTSSAGQYGTFDNSAALTNLGMAQSAWLARYLLGVPSLTFGGAPTAQPLQVSGGTVTARANIPAVSHPLATASYTVKLWASNDNGWTFSSFPMALESPGVYAWSGPASGTWASPASVAWFAVVEDQIAAPLVGLPPTTIDWRSTPPVLPAGFTQVLRPRP